MSDISREEAALTHFEYAAWHLASAFAKWRRDCLASLPENDLSGSEASILHIVHMNGTAKGLAEISRLLHRDDTANLQYGIKKLIGLGHIIKADSAASPKLTTYVTTDKGQALIDAYKARREEILLGLTQALPGMYDTIESTTNVLHVMVGLYEQASEIATSRPLPAQD
jgi:predicted MarR family transcription regulator